jgi:SAM-dependent methyltransferase
MLSCRLCGGFLAGTEAPISSVAGNGDRSSLIAGWKTYYVQKTEAYSEDSDWWTLACWRKYLFAEVLRDLGGKLVVDVGCGTAARVAAIAPIQKHHYLYIGVDSSPDALQRAAVNMAGGYFACTDLTSLQLQPQTADVVLCLGVLMYFPSLDPLLNQILCALKPGGILLLHEQLRRRSWRTIRDATTACQSHCPPDGYNIREIELRRRLAQEGYLRTIHRSGSPLRAVLLPLLSNSSWRTARPLASWLDSLWCGSVGRIVPDLGAGEIQLVFQKHK